MGEKRNHPRTRKRMTCRLRAGGREASGVVRDLSATGLFIQVQGAAANPGEEVELTLNLSGGGRLELRGVAARKEAVPAHLAGMRQGGVGIRLLDPPPEWQSLVGTDGCADAAASSAAPREDEAGATAPHSTFRVRASMPGTPRTRTVTQAAESPEDARSLVQAKLGSDWEIAGIEPA